MEHMIWRRRRTKKGGGVKRYDSFSGSDLWLPPQSCVLPQIETRLTVLTQEMTERQNNLTEQNRTQSSGAIFPPRDYLSLPVDTVYAAEIVNSS